MKRASFVRAAQACLLSLIFSSQIATAAILTYEFTGEVARVAPALEGAFDVGELLVGRFNVDTDNATQQSYRTIYDASNLLVTVGGDYSLIGTTGSMIVVDDHALSDGDSFDSLTVAFSNSSTPSVFGPKVNGHSPGYFDIQLDWFDDQNPFDSQDLPASVRTDLGALDRSNINFPSDSERLSYKLTTMTLVPVPTAVWLFSSALGLLGWIKRRCA